MIPVFDSAYRHLIDIFLPPMDFLEAGADEEQWNANLKIYESVVCALKGEILLEEAIEEIEGAILYGDVDRYLDEVERDLGIWWNHWERNGKIYLPQSCSLIEKMYT